MPKSVQKRLDEGRAVYDLGMGPQDPDTAAEADGTPETPDGAPVLAPGRAACCAAIPTPGRAACCVATPTCEAQASCPARLLQSMGLGPSDALDDQKPEYFEEFYDDVSGETLPPSLTREARMEEIRFMQDWKVWEVRTIQECKEVTGKAPIGGRWVDHNKGDAESPKIRCRWVAKDIAKWRDDAMFAAPPPPARGGEAPLVGPRHSAPVGGPQEGRPTQGVPD